MPAMPDILHKVGIRSSSLDRVYDALTAIDGLAGWWTSDTQGEGKVGGVLRFRFGSGGFDMNVLALHPVRHVLWQVADGPEEWIGTTISFDLEQRGDWTIVLFKHAGWKDPVEFMHVNQREQGRNQQLPVGCEYDAPALVRLRHSITGYALVDRLR